MTSDSRRGSRRFSLAGRLTAGLTLVLVLMAGLAALASQAGLGFWGAFLLTLLVGVPVGAWMVSRLLRPVAIVLRGVSDGVRSFRDRDFSVRLAYRREDELGELVLLYNRLGEVLQEERRTLRQRELLLRTALDRSPSAIILLNERGRVLYSNREARDLLLGGDPLEGRAFEEIRDGCPLEMRELLASEGDGLFTVGVGDERETFQLSQRVFRLNYRRHVLVMLRRLTGDLGRQEAAAWKKVLQVVSHELNNSLAPVSSLIHSARLAAADPAKRDRLEGVFQSIRSRLDHLKRFLDGYARFARLPPPRKEEVRWEELWDTLGELPSVRLGGGLPTRPGWFDRAQIQQVLVNLVKNAEEASEGEPEVELRFESSPETGSYIQVSDRGRGMTEETMRKALLPFYSTKKSGTGLGLALCREILEAHGGKLDLAARAGGGLRVTCWIPDR